MDPSDREREEIFDQLIIVESLRARLEQPRAQPFPMPGVIVCRGKIGALVHAAPSLRSSEQLLLDHRIALEGRGHAASGTVLRRRG